MGNISAAEADFLQTGHVGRNAFAGVSLDEVRGFIDIAINSLVTWPEWVELGKLERPSWLEAKYLADWPAELAADGLEMTDVKDLVRTRVSFFYDVLQNLPPP
jgi:hypothetical protein